MTTPGSTRRPQRALDSGAVSIAPVLAPARAGLSRLANTAVPVGNDHDKDEGLIPKQPFKPYACQSCVRRKVRCDRASPTCSSCTKAKFDCQYRAPPPPQRAATTKRRREGRGGGIGMGADGEGDGYQELRDRLQRYERVLQDNGLLRAADDGAGVSSPVGGGQDQRLVSQPDKVTQISPYGGVDGNSRTHPGADVVQTGKLLAGDGKSRYINSQLWLDAGEAEMAEMSEHDQNHKGEPERTDTTTWGIHSLAQDPLSGALLGNSQNLLAYHPLSDHALKLWDIHVTNVGPLCKILHHPTTARMVQTVCQVPAAATKAQECLVFCIYYVAVLSLDDAECQLEFGQARSVLLKKYEFATRQALVNASWLKTTDLSVLQAYVLLLIAMRGRADSHTYWILTGVAVRISQRMGLHRDGESLGLSPYDVEMRRRLFWQLVPLDTYAAQISGTGIAIAPGSWDTKQPRNINDDQIYPGMETSPEEHKGATEMLFCLARAKLSNLYARAGVRARQMGPTVDLRERAELDKLVDETEGTIEAEYLRYCDILNPLHVLTLGVVRSAANVVRLRSRIKPLVTGQAVSDGRLRELCTLARRILDTDSALHRDRGTRGFRWHLQAHFLWDALVCVLAGLARPGFFAAAASAERGAAWAALAEVYANRAELAEGRGAIQASVGRATLAAWRANPPRSTAQREEDDDEPAFIRRLRQVQERGRAGDGCGEGEGTTTSTPTAGSLPSSADGGAGFLASMGPLLGNLDGAQLGLDGDFSMGAGDWMFWNPLPPSEGTDFA